jgi:hypothetical protein
MKKYLFITLIAALVINISIRAQMDQRQLYEHKIKTYIKTRNAGRVLTIAGVGVTVIGTGLLVSYISDQVNYRTDSEYGPKYYGGVYGTALGIDMIIGGVILNSVGSHKVRQYRSKLNNLSMGVIYTPEKQGISLVYKF